MSRKPGQEGKVFTNVISKMALEVKIKTINSRIDGELHKQHDERLLDSLANGNQFVALTNARIRNENEESKDSIKIPFMVLNRDQIEWIIPKE